MPMYFFLKIWLITFAVSSAYELLALNTPFNIFGCRYQYDYNRFLFKKSFLKVPLMIPFFWATTRLFIPSYLGFIWIDLIVDPAAIQLKWWKWQRKGLWFGVPLTNYIGWSIIWLTVEGIKYAIN